MKKVGIGIWLWIFFISLSVGLKATLFLFIGIPVIFILWLIFGDLWYDWQMTQFRQKEEGKQLYREKKRREREAKKKTEIEAGLGEKEQKI